MQIWTLADTENQGFLTQKTWSIALRLIAQAQKGERPTPEMANKRSPSNVCFCLTFERVRHSRPLREFPVLPAQWPLDRPPVHPSPLPRQRTPFPLWGPRNGSATGICLPIQGHGMAFLTANKHEQSSCEPVSPTRLSDKYGGPPCIGSWLTWRNLADVHNRGALDIGEFTIAMHLIQSFMSGTLTSVPASLPPELYASANVSSPVVPSAVGGFGGLGRTDSVSSAGSGSMPPLVPPKIQQSPIREDFTGGSQMEGWDVTRQDKTAFDNLFRGIDTGNKGFIDGYPPAGNSMLTRRQRGSFLLLDVQVAG